MQRISCEPADQIGLLHRKHENIDYFIATTDELVKKFGSLVRGPKQAQQL
jgi:hypothetical protein